MISMEYPNWFEKNAIHYFNLILPKRFAGKPLIDFLQIGAYTGDASEWMLENILTDPSSWLTDVDTWSGSEEEAHKAFDWKSLESFYDNRMSKYNNICKIKSYSDRFLLSAETNHYDFIYIDGDHTANGAYLDAHLSWHTLKPYGIMAFDDYQWSHESGEEMLKPKPGIDKFLEEHKGEYHLLIMDEQVWISKNG
jgi:predicted O-methyltransferase YrrM